MKLEVSYDPSPEWDVEGFEFFSFSSRHYNFKHPDEIANLEEALENQTAFFLSYFEHGDCIWSLMGEGPSCPFDSVVKAGLIFVPEDIPENKREEAARSILKDYTNWCNGHVLMFTIEDEDGSIVDSCAGFFEKEELIESIHSSHPGVTFSELTGNAMDSFIAESMNA